MSNKRRANGEGSICKRADGRWMARYRVTEPNGVRVTKAVYAKSKEDVARKLRKALSEIDNGQVTMRNSYTVSSFYQMWLVSIAPNYLQPTSIEQYEWVFSKYILPHFGKKRLNQMFTKDIQNFISSLHTKTKSARTCKAVKDCLSGVMERAVRQQLIVSNPVYGVEVPMYKPKEKQPWSIDELNKFLFATSKCNYYPIYRLASYYGMRKGEVLGIRVMDVDLHPQNGCYGIIHIRQQVSLVNNKPVIRKRLKTKSSERDLPINEEIKNLLLPLLKNRDEEELLFHTSNGKPISPNNLLRAFKRDIKKANLREVDFHSLRHTACTLLRDAGVDIKTAQVIMGHSDPYTTLKVYQHSNIDNEIEALSKLNALYDVCS